MPAVHFTICWPDNSEDACYSPSSIIRDYFSVGESIPLKEFIPRTEQALNDASNRVKEKFGFHCSSAMNQLAVIKTKGQSFNDREQHVKIIRFS